MKPSLFDLQVNGFAGVDYQRADLRPEEVEASLHALHQHGTGRILLTLISDRIESLALKLRRLESFRRNSEWMDSMVPGYHIEGPYLSPLEGYRGAHPAGVMKDPEPAELDLLQEAAGGRIRLVTLAPERKNSAEFIRHATGQGVCISLGHTAAGDPAIDEAISAGATMATHLGNGVPSILPRHDNVIQRLLSRDELIACFIPDGIHLPFFVLRNFLRVKPEGKVLFTTDCMSAAGAPPGRYLIAGHTVEVGADRVVREPGKPNFAGSALAPDEGVDNLCRHLGYPKEKAEELFGAAVARALGLPE